MTAVSRTAAPLFIATQPTPVAVPMTPFFLARTDRLKSPPSSIGAVSGRSIVAAAGGSRSASAYASTVDQMNQDLLAAQADNQRQLQARGNSTGGGGTGVTDADLVRSQTEAMDLLKLQVAMQRENQYFTMISNILKTRHETLKTIIGNIR